MFRSPCVFFHRNCKLGGHHLCGSDSRQPANALSFSDSEMKKRIILSSGRDSRTGASHSQQSSYVAPVRARALSLAGRGSPCSIIINSSSTPRTRLAVQAPHLCGEPRPRYGSDEIILALYRENQSIRIAISMVQLPSVPKKEKHSQIVPPFQNIILSSLQIHSFIIQ